MDRKPWPHDVITNKSTQFLAPKITGAEPVVPAYARLSKDERDFLAAQIAYLPPELADLFVLTEIRDEQ